MRRVARTVNLLIWGLAIALPFFFAWVKLGNFPYSQAADYLNPNVTRNFLIALYYTSWVFGAKSDTAAQERVYSVDEGKIQLPVKAVGYIIGFGVMAGVLLWAVDNDKLFSIALDVLLVLNVLGFAYILRFVAPAICISRAEYEKRSDAPKLLKLDVTVNYMTGAWQWARFALGGAILAALTLACFSERYRDYFSAIIANKIGFRQETVAQLLADVLVAAFIITMDGWIWAKRLAREVSIRTIDRIAAQYRLVRDS
jgi:hypothetical protein